MADRYEIVLCDVPWAYYGNPDKMGAAGKEYRCMPDEDVLRLDVRSYMRTSRQTLLFLWATCPRLDFAIECVNAWGLCYRGVAFVWTKTRADGKPIGAQGTRATVTKPTTELVLAASPMRRGRPLKIADERVAQAILAPRGEHSEKPEEVHRRIERMYPVATKCELFARRERVGWTCIGDELPVPSQVRLRPEHPIARAGHG